MVGLLQCLLERGSTGGREGREIEKLKQSCPTVLKELHRKKLIGLQTETVAIKLILNYLELQMQKNRTLTHLYR